MTENAIIVEGNGHKSWYLNGKPHREDGPAVEYANGHKSWWLNGELHREDGPAVEETNHKSWYLNGELHREDGPAIEYANGHKLWCLNGECLTEEEFNKRINKKTIVIDGKTVEISAESYEELKKSLI